MKQKIRAVRVYRLIYAIVYVRGSLWLWFLFDVFTPQFINDFPLSLFLAFIPLKCIAWMLRNWYHITLPLFGKHSESQEIKIRIFQADAEIMVVLRLYLWALPVLCIVFFILSMQETTSFCINCHCDILLKC